MAATGTLIQGIRAIPGLEIIGQPKASLFAFRSTEKKLGIYAVGDQMEERGWHIDRQQKPESLHAMVTPMHKDVAEQYLADLSESVAFVRNNPGLSARGSAATYGMVSKVPLRKMVKKNVLEIMKKSYGPGGGSLDISEPGKGDWKEKLAKLFLRLRG